MNTPHLRYVSLCLLASLVLSGCVSVEGDSPSVSWWIPAGLGAILLAGTLAGLRYRQRLQSMKAALDTRVSLIEQQRKELESLYRADEELRRHLHLNEVLQSLVKTAIELLHADKGALMVWDETREKLVVRASFGFHPETAARIALGPGQGLAGKVALIGEPAFVEDARQDGRVTPFIIESEHLYSVMQVPIRVAGEVFGVFSADYLQPHHFSEAEKRLLMAFAQRAGLAIETARLYEREAQIAVMQERNRLARELHDSVTQSLYGVLLYAEVSGQLLQSGDLEKVSEQLQALKNMASDALGEMRLLIYELRPSVFEQEGLVAAIQTRLDAVEGRVGLETNFIVEGEISLPPHVEESLYWITHEALNNILKHAQARTATVTLTMEKNSVWLEIADDGIGFDPNQASKAGGMGLRGMQERALEMGAEIEFISQVGSGAKVRVRRQAP